MESDFIDSDSIAVRWGSLATSLFGIVYYGFVSGWVSYIERVGTAIGGRIDNLAEFLAEIVYQLLDTPASMFESAVIRTMLWVEGIGLLAPVVAVALSMILTMILLWTIQEAFALIWGVF